MAIHAEPDFTFKQNLRCMYYYHPDSMEKEMEK